MTLPAFLKYEFLGNTIGQYLVAVLILLVGAVFRRLLSRLLSKLLFALTKRYTGGVSEDELHSLLIQPLSVLLLVVTLQLAGATLTYPHGPTAVAAGGQLPWHEVLLLQVMATGYLFSDG